MNVHKITNATLQMHTYMIHYDVVKSKRRHWLAVTLSFTPCGDRQIDFYNKIKSK